MTTLPPSCADCQEIGILNILEPSGPVTDLDRDYFTLSWLIYYTNEQFSQHGCLFIIETIYAFYSSLHVIRRKLHNIYIYVSFVYVCMYVYMYVRTYVCIYVCIYTVYIERETERDRERKRERERNLNGQNNKTNREYFCLPF